MNYDKIREMLLQLNIPVAYWMFDEDDAPTAPYIVFELPDSQNFCADGCVYNKTNTLYIELYTDKKSPELEEKLEKLLDENGLCYQRQEYYLADEKLFEELYRMEV